MAVNCSINAVYDKELEGLLEDLEMLDDLRANKLRCYYCHQVVNISSFGAIFPYNDDIKVCCDSPKCTLQMLRSLNEG